MNRKSLSLKSLVSQINKITPGAAKGLKFEVLLFALTFPVSVAVNRSLGAEDRGMLAIALLIPTTVFVLGSCQWDVLVKGFLTTKRISIGESWSLTKCYSIWLSALVIPVGIVCTQFAPNITDDSRLASSLYCLNFPFYFLCGVLSSIFVASGSMERLYSMRIVMQGAQLLLVGVLSWFSSLTVASMIGVYFLIHVISLAHGIGFVYSDGRVEKQFRAPIWKHLIHGFIPNLLNTLASRTDVWAFTFFCSTAALGQYTGTSALLLPVGLLSTALTNASTANLNWTDQNAVKKYLVGSGLFLLTISTIMVIALLSVGEGIVELVLGRSFSVPGGIIALVAVNSLLTSTANQYHVSLQLAGRTREFLIIQATEPLARIGLVFIMGSYFNASGIIMAMAGLSLTKIATCCLLHQRLFHRTDTDKALFDYP